LLFYLAILIFTYVSARKNKSCFAHNWPPHLVWRFSSHWRYDDITTFFTVPILLKSSETRSVWFKQALNTRRWLVNALVTWHVSYKITTLLDNSKGSTWSSDLSKTMIYPNSDSMGISRVQKLKIKDPKVSWYRHNVNVTKITGRQMKRSKIWTKTSMIFS